MAELLAKSSYKPALLKRGQNVEATVAQLSPKQILLDIDGKSEAVVLERDKRILSDLLKILKVGDRVQAYVLDPESDLGFTVVSLRGFRSRRAWDKLKKAKEEDSSVEAQVVETTRGGILVEVMGIQGFIPLSHLTDTIESLTPGSTIDVKIIELDAVSDRLVLSQKQASVKAKDMLEILEKIEIGKAYKGEVCGITKFGIFVLLTEGPLREASPLHDSSAGIDFSKASVEGLVHISEISYEKISDPATLFHLGDEVEVMVIGKDTQNQKLNLSLKQLMQDPFASISEKLTKDKEVQGVVTKVSKFGIFVMLDDGVEGLIHHSKIPLGTAFTEGQKVTCTVESVDVKRRRIALTPILKEKPVGYR